MCVESKLLKILNYIHNKFIVFRGYINLFIMIILYFINMYMIECTYYWISIFSLILLNLLIRNILFMFKFRLVLSFREWDVGRYITEPSVIYSLIHPQVSPSKIKINIKMQRKVFFSNGTMKFYLWLRRSESSLFKKI